MFEFLLLPIFAALNRMRGDDRWMRKTRVHPQQELGPQWLPGRPLYYVAPVVGLLALFVLPPLAAAAFGLAYLIWGTLAWGRWYDLGRMPDNYNRVGQDLDPYEAIVEKLSWGSDHVAMIWRHLMIAPGLALVGFAIGDYSVLFLAPVFAGFVVMAYETAWQNDPAEPILSAEIFTGVIWGLLLIILGFFA